MPRKKYERRFLSDREILAGIKQSQEQRRAPRKVHAEVWRWLHDGRDGLLKAIANYDSLRWEEKACLVDRWTAPVNHWFIQDAKIAARQTFPAFPTHGAKFYNRHDLMAAYCLMLWLNLGFRGLNARLLSPAFFVERLLVFGKLKRLPHPSTVRRFVTSLDSKEWKSFLDQLRLLNPDLALIVETRHICE